MKNRTTLEMGIEKMQTEQLDAYRNTLQTVIQQYMDKSKKEHTKTMTETIDAIKAEASITFSLELQAQAQEQLREIHNLTQSNYPPNSTTPTPEQQPHHQSNTSKYWTEKTNHTPSSAKTPTTLPTDRFKLARSKELESKLPHFRKDQMYIHLPNEPL